MRSPDPFEGLSTFLVVARRRSFRRAAAELGVTPGAVSHAISALEKRLGMPLFQRTTRAVALTDAGEALLSRVEPATSAIGEAFGEIETMRERPTGKLWVTVPRLAVPLFIEPALPRLREAHPDVEVEVSVDDAFVDLGANGFDAGIRVGDWIGRDMVAVRLSPDLSWCVVGAPSYFQRHGHPKTLRDLANHQTIRKRQVGSDAMYRWELEDEGRPCTVDTKGAVVVNDGPLGLALARAGLGLLYTADLYVTEDLARGTLVRTLERHATTSAGFYLYFSAGAQHQPKLRAFVDILTAIRPGPRTRRGRSGTSRRADPALLG